MVVSAVDCAARRAGRPEEEKGTSGRFKSEAQHRVRQKGTVGFTAKEEKEEEKGAGVVFKEEHPD